jgi:hypothetical protein
MTSPARTVDGLIAVYEASREAFGGRAALNLPALNVRVSDMLDALEEVAGPKVRALVRFERDERIAGIVANWPSRCHGRARGPARPASAREFCRHHSPIHRRLRRAPECGRNPEGNVLMSKKKSPTPVSTSKPKSSASKKSPAALKLRSQAWFDNPPMPT